MIGVLQVQVQAHNPNMPLCPCFTFKGSPSSLRIMGVPKQIGSWRITEVYATFHYPDDSEKTKLAVREGNVYVATVDGCDTAGEVENGLTISANGVDEDGNAVSGYVLGRGDISVMEGDSIVPDPGVVKNYLKLCDSLPDTPVKGDAYFQNGMLVIYDGTIWVPSADLSEKRDKLDLTVYEQTRAPFVERFKSETTGEWVEITYTWSKPPPFETYLWWEEGPWSTANKLTYEEGRGWLLGNGIGPMTVISTEPEDALVVHRQNVPDWTFTRQSIYETVPTEDTLAKVSEIHGDYIEDANENKICADRTTTYMGDGTPYWTVTYNGENYQLSGTRESSSYYPENPQVGDLAFSLEYYGYWYFTVYERYDDGNEQQWDQINNFESYDSEDANELYYEDQSTDPPTQVKFAEWTTPQVLIQGELAVKSDLPTKTSDLTNDSDFVNSQQLSAKVNNDGGVAKVRKMTQAQYDALASKDSTTLYVITEN